MSLGFGYWGSRVGLSVLWFKNEMRFVTTNSPGESSIFGKQVLLYVPLSQRLNIRLSYLSLLILKVIHIEKQCLRL